MTVFDINEKVTLLETRILSNRLKIKRDDEGGKEVAIQKQRKVHILDAEAGLFSIFQGKDWSLLNMKSLVEWQLKKAMPLADNTN
jgi:hypothetical protein